MKSEAEATKGEAAGAVAIGQIRNKAIVKRTAAARAPNMKTVASVVLCRVGVQLVPVRHIIGHLKAVSRV